MKLKDAGIKVDNQIMSYGGYWRPLSMMLRLIEETGELARAVNIKYGDKRSKNVDDGRAVSLELADVFYTTLALSNLYKIKLKDVEISDLQSSLNVEKDNINFLALPCEISKKVGALSGLMSDENSNTKAIKNLISDIINIIIKVATMYEVDLSSVFSNKVGADVDKMDKVYKD